MKWIRTPLSRYLNPHVFVSIFLTVTLVVTSMPANTLAQSTPPTKPLGVTAIQTGPNQVYISWNITGWSAVKGFRIERANDPSFNTSINVSTNRSNISSVIRFTVGPTVNSYSDKTVSPGNIYFYRVFAVTDTGDSLSSDVVVVLISDSSQTPQVKPTIITDQPFGITEKKVTLTGSLNETGSATRVLVYFQWGADTGYGNIADPKVMSAPGTFTVTLKNLRSNTTYHYRAVAIGQGAGTVYGEDKVFKTSPSSPATDIPAIPSGIHFESSRSVVAKVNAGADAELKSFGNKIALKVPKGALKQDTDIELTEYVSLRTAGKQIVSLFALKANEALTLNSVKQFDKDLHINITHTEADLKGLNTKSLHLYYFDENNNTWVPVNSVYDSKTKTLSATVNHFTLFGEMADPLKSGPGLVTAFQNDLQSGAATGVYPIEVPPGPGGFQPKINLQYNSGSVDEMKNKRAVGSWVGIGWSLNLGSISYDEANDRYSLELNGTGYTLAPGANNTYHTFPDKFLKVTRSGNQWDVRDRDGNYYRFGGTTDSQQYHDTNVYYRWDLSRMQGSGSNLTFIDIVYTQDSWNSTIRSAYPSVLKYTDGQGNDTVRVSFNSSFDYTSADGNMRFDTPNGTALHPAPPIVENKKLDSIEVKIYTGGAWQLIRKYYFAYAYTNTYYSTDYGGTYYSGNYTLSSITQKNSSDNLSLPATTFTYEGKQTYLNDTTTGNYTGDPGNPASFNWPHLTVIKNGYGANVTFGYTQIPGTSVADIWTREVVTSKTINSGIGPAETHTYTYTGYPQYLVNDSNEWASKFRGFSQVQDTDAAGNYVIHYFNTIDPDDGNAEKLTGLETKTEWYSSNGTLLRKVENQWGWSDSAQAYDLLRRWGAISQFASPQDVAVADDGTIFVADTDNHRILRFTSSGNILGIWGSYGNGNGQFNYPSGIAVTGSPGGWWNAGWTIRNKLTLNTTSISSNLTSFPVLVHLTASNFNFNSAQADGGDLRFIGADNTTVLDYEIEKWTASEAWVWVRLPQLTGNSTSGFIWVYYGNSNAANGWNPQGVWDSNHKMVQHLEETDIDGGAGDIKDATTYGNNGTTHGMNTADQVAGRVDGCFDFDGTDDYVSVTDNDAWTFGNFTISLWVKANSWAGNWWTRAFAGQDEGGGSINKWIFSYSGETLFHIQDTTGGGPVMQGNAWTPQTGVWYYIGVSRSGSTYTFFRNGAADGSPTNSYTIPNAAAPLTIGWAEGAGSFNGILDEVRISSTARSADWMKASYLSETDAMITYGATETSFVYVADTNNNRIQKFTSTGTFVTAWGASGNGTGNFTNPTGVAVDNSSNVYVVDNGNNRIQKFTSSGNFVAQWGSSGNGSGNFTNPYGIAVGADGYVYVADTGNYRVQKFNSNGTFVAKWGSNGTGNSQFNQPKGLAVDAAGSVYVADTNNHRIQKFDSSGNFTAAWGSPGSDSGQFSYPRGVAVDTNNNTFVADTSNHRIQRFDSSGNFSAAWGSYGSGNGQLGTPQGVAASGNGSVYVVDSLSSRILKFTGTGNYTISWGSYGNSTGQFVNPYGVAVGPDGSVYIADQGNHRIQKFTSNGTFVTTWGAYGNSTGNFSNPTGIAVDNSSNVYVVDNGNNRIQKFTSNGSYVAQWGSSGNGSGNFTNPYGVAVGPDGYVYVADTGNNRVQKFSNNGTFVAAWGSYGTGNNQFDSPRGIAVDSNSNVYVADTNNFRVLKFTSSGTFVTVWDIPLDGDNYMIYPLAVAVGSDGYVFVASGNTIKKFTRDFTVHLDQITETTGSKVSQTRYAYDSFGNVVTEYHDGDTANGSDNRTIWRVFYPNTTTNILGKVARERIYSGTVTSDNGGANLKAETTYYYDNNNTSYNTSPTKGLLTRVEQKKDASNSISSYFTYDNYGNKLTEQDTSGNTTQTTYETTYHTYPTGKTYAVSGMTENYTYDPGSTNMLTLTDINGQVTTYTYDTFKRLISVDKPLGQNPDIQYEYNSWGTINQQHIKTKTWIDGINYLWQSQYFDGLGRVVQVHSNGETNVTIVSGTITYNSRGLIDKEYVTQNISGNLTSYQTPTGSWKYVTYTYDGLGRVTQKINADSTWVTYDLSTAWQNTVTDELGYNTAYYFDAFGWLTKIQEPGTGTPTTNYSYDTMGNLIQVTDATGNITSITYDWLSRKTYMVDPDMGGWGYSYDNNGNLITQTDNKSQTITFNYDALNRLTGKTYPAGANMTNVGYSYDNGTYGKGQRTRMTDASGNTTYQYDQRGRLITENRTFNGDNATYSTRFGYDGADRLSWIIYPTGENVTQTYNGRGLPYTLSGNVSGNLVTSTLYNALGMVTEMNFNNSLRTTFGYWGTGGAYDTTGGYYGRLWEIKTVPQAGGTALMDVQHTWDAGGNLASRQDVLVGQTETFAYDTLNRLTSVTGPYSENFTYNTIGNILSKNGVSYTYGGNKPHAITSVGSTNYTYDNNGNMLTRGSQNITWDAENRPISIAFGIGNSTDNWWDASWTIRKKLTFNTTAISSNLTSFPMLVHLTASNFIFGYAQADGGDLRFIGADNTTVLDYEIEKWTGSEAWVWVRLPQLTGNSTGTFIWMYYGNANAANGWNATGVWDSNHKMVQHLEETDIDGGTGDIKDSTIYGNNGTTTGMNASAQVAGKVDGNFNFDGTDDYVGVPDNNAWAFGNFTISLWVNANSWAGNWWTRAFAGQDEGGYNKNKWVFTYSNDYGATLFHIQTPSGNGPHILGNAWTPQTGVWYNIGITKSGNNYTFYRNGATDGSPTDTYTIPNAAAPLTIGWAEGTGGFNGMLDEVRISDTARSADWMKASYLSETDAMITYGATESTSNSATFVYDGDGNRVKKTESGQTVLYVNKYYEKNLTTGNVTSYYYSGNKLVAEREGSTLRYFHHDSLSSTSLMTDSSGGSLGTIKFAPFGSARSGSVPTDIQFTGQRLDATDLYYYGARFYDPAIGRFISPDTIVQDTTNPQSFNRYSYVLNNPLKYTDPTGRYWEWSDESMMDIWYPDDAPPTVTPTPELTPTLEPTPVPTPNPTPTPTPPSPSLPLAPTQPIVPEVPPEPEPPEVTMTPEPVTSTPPASTPTPQTQHPDEASKGMKKLGTQALGAIIWVAVEIPPTVIIIASVFSGTPIPWHAIGRYEIFVAPVWGYSLWLMAGAPGRRR